MLTINLEWDANALAAPQSFRDGVRAAADILEAAILDPIMVNISVGYGEIDEGGSAFEPLTGNISLGGTAPLPPILVAYPALRAALVAAATSPEACAALAALPNTATLNGQLPGGNDEQPTFAISGAQAKALGAIPASDPAVDGFIGFPPSFTGTALTEAALVEIMHAMGLLTGGYMLSLFEYTSPGQHLLFQGSPASPAYFSLDGGNTDLANYDVGFDATLFLTAGDALSVGTVSGGVTALSPLDLAEISAIGFNVTAAPSLPAPNITPSVTAAGVPAAVQVQNVYVEENAAIPALSLIKSVSAPNGDVIPYYRFFDQGIGNGHFVFEGVVEPGSQGFDVLATQLGSLQYVGSSPGNQVIGVVAFDYTTDSFTSPAYLTATTVAPALIMRNGGNGSFQTYSIAGNALGNGVSLGEVGLEFTVAGFGDFSGVPGESDMLMRDGDNGVFELYDLSDNTIAIGAPPPIPGATPTLGTVPAIAGAAPIGEVGLEFGVAGIGDFSGNANESDMLMRSTVTGAFEIYDIADNALVSAAPVGEVGLEFTIAGVGDFSGNPNETDLLMRDGNNGVLEVYDIVHNAIVSAAPLGEVGLEFTVVGVGDFSGNPNETDLLMRDVNTGAFEVYDIAQNALVSAAAIGEVGLEWQVAGFGNFSGNPNETDMLMRNVNTGALEVYDISRNAITSAAAIGEIGLESKVAGITPVFLSG